MPPGDHEGNRKASNQGHQALLSRELLLPNEGAQRTAGKASSLPPSSLEMASLGEDLLGIVNKLQDLVFNTIGNDSLDLPQIVYPTTPLLLPIVIGCRDQH